MRRVVVTWLALWTQALIIGIPSVLLGWWGIVVGAAGLTIANSVFELGKHTAQATGTSEDA